MSSKFIGHDVSVYSVQSAGFQGRPALGGSTSLLGRWESIEITVTNEWHVVTSSDALEPEKRWKYADFHGSCRGWIDQGGSQQLFLFPAGNLCVITFTEVNSGVTMVARAGITTVGATWGGDSGKDSLTFEDVGPENFAGLSTLSYGVASESGVSPVLRTSINL